MLVRCESCLPVKAAWCCQHVCGFRYADDMLPDGNIENMRVLIVEDEPSTHRAAPPHPPASRSADRGSYPPGSCVPRLSCDGCRRSAPAPRPVHRPRSRRSTPQPRPGQAPLDAALATPFGPVAGLGGVVGRLHSSTRRGAHVPSCPSLSLICAVGDRRPGADSRPRQQCIDPTAVRTANLCRAKTRCKGPALEFLYQGHDRTQVRRPAVGHAWT